MSLYMFTLIKRLINQNESQLWQSIVLIAEFCGEAG
jgi:hypothetical protein